MINIETCPLYRDLYQIVNLVYRPSLSLPVMSLEYVKYSLKNPVRLF